MSRRPQLILGLDIGGSSIKCVLVGEDRSVRGEFTTDSLSAQGPEKLRDAALSCFTHFAERGLAPTSVGIGIAGSIDHAKGVVRNSPNFSGWKDVPFGKWMEERLQVPVLLENDANAAAYGEARAGSVNGFPNCIFLTLGTGIGGGIILDGKLYRGATGSAGEIGHFSIDPAGPLCGCGHTGCFERLCSASAIKKLYAKSPENFLSEKSPDLEVYLGHFSRALISLGNVFDPHAFILGGAMAQGLKPHMEFLKSEVRTRAFPAVAAEVRIEFATLGNRAGSMGAALLSLDASI